MEYQIMFYGGMAGAAIALTIAILVYIKLNIAQVITDLTGRNFPGADRKARKRSASAANTGNKPFTKEINVRKNVEMEVAAGEGIEPTEKMARQASFESTELLSGSNQAASAAATTLLSPGRLSGGPSETMMISDWPETMVLTADQDETTVLDETMLLTEEESRFKKQVDIVIVHSQTTI